MTASKILGAALALALIGSTAALADDHWDHDHGHDGYKNHGQERAAEAHAANEARAEQRAHDRWVKGHRFDRQYMNNKYYVSNYRTYHLRKPPHGYRWYRADDQYVLVRRDNGVISDIINALK